MCAVDNNSADIPVLVIFGPTASGKTSLAERLFASASPEFPDFTSLLPFPAGIISADSMQVYTQLDIGTAKPPKQLLERLPHYLIDICSPRQQFTAGDFVRLADGACSDLYRRGALPVVLGGTAFYIKNFLYGLPETPGSDTSARLELRRRMDKEGAEPLWGLLHELDPVSAERIHINDEYRILRALEVCSASGKPLSSFAVPATLRSGYRFLILALDRPRDELYRRIDRRVEEMFEAGLRKEFLGLLAAGYTEKDPGMQAIGYREFFMTGRPAEEADTEAVKALIQRDSRRYAKRQYTFFRSIEGVQWFSAEDSGGIAAAVCGFTGQTHSSPD